MDESEVFWLSSGEMECPLTEGGKTEKKPI